MLDQIECWSIAHIVCIGLKVTSSPTVLPLRFLVPAGVFNQNQALALVDTDSGFEQMGFVAIIIGSVNQSGDILGKQEPPQPIPACKNLLPMRSLNLFP